MYKILLNNYEKYCEIHEELIDTPQGKAIKDEEARYFIVYKYNEFFCDFVIYNNNNWITLKKLLDDNELISEVKSSVKAYYDSINFIIPVEDEEKISNIVNQWGVSSINDLKQSVYFYKVLNVIL